MLSKKGLITGCLLVSFLGLFSQVSPDCGTAIPICNNTPVTGGVQGYGQDDFWGVARTGCLEGSLSGDIESNSAWYRFRTAASGQLGFNIGFDAAEDWDFALYRASDCGDLGEPIRCNFFDNQDRETYMGVGEDPTGNTETFLYEPWLEVEPGQDYYLLINNFSNANTGFSIQFSGEIFQTNPDDALDCSIIDNLLGPPVAACEGSPVLLDASTTHALGYQWFLDTGSGYQTIPGITTPTHLAATSGFYRVVVALPGGSQIISDVQVTFSPAAIAYPIADMGNCGGTSAFNLHDLDDQALGDQSPDEFRVSYHLSPSDAGQGINALPPEWLPSPGSLTVYYRVSSLQNPNCYDASRHFELIELPPPTLELPPQALLCEGGNPPLLGPLIPEEGVSYQWSSGETSHRISPAEPGSYTLTATRTEGDLQCEISQTVEVIASVPPAIDQIRIADLQTSNTVTVEPAVQGNFEYALNDGPYQSSPVFEGVPPGSHRLQMRDVWGCGTLTETITVVGYNTFFTPNGDGYQDLWQISGLEQLTDPVVYIFDRYGKMIKQLDDTSAGWDGTFNGRPLPATDYWFRLEYEDQDGQRINARYLRTHFSLKR